MVASCDCSSVLRVQSSESYTIIRQKGTKTDSYNRIVHGLKEVPNARRESVKFKSRTITVNWLLLMVNYYKGRR